VRQLTQIERRQARIRRIRQKLPIASTDIPTAENPADAHHHIGTSDKLPQDIGSFLRTNTGDPAIKVQLLG
jgi:hypothetical protein